MSRDFLFILLSGLKPTAYEYPKTQQQLETEVIIKNNRLAFKSSLMIWLLSFEG